MRLRLLVAVVLVASVVSPIAARADGTDCSVAAGASMDSPNLSDPPGDWNGVATGTTGSVPAFGDITQSSGDIVALWFTTDGKKYTAHVGIASLGDPTKGYEGSESIFVLFNDPRSKISDGNGGIAKDVFLSATTNPRGTISYQYGYLSQGTAQGQINDVGAATGKYIAGAPGEIDITIPSPLGQPQPGDVIGSPGVTIYFVAGVEYTPVDDTSNADGCLDGITA